MRKQITLDDIFKTIINKLNDPKVELVRMGVVGTVDIFKPAIGLAADVGNSFLSSYNEFKLNCLLHGLSSGLNVEMRMNQLYTYVNSNNEKAIIVANTFKRTINAECPKVCILYGLILADHLDDNTEFTNDELIVCRALEGATDFDLNNFKQIMEEFLKPGLGENIKVSDCQVYFPKNFDREIEFNATCDWCVYNRLFTAHEPEWKAAETVSTLYLDKNYYATNAADILLKYIRKAHQTWDYQQKR